MSDQSILQIDTDEELARVMRQLKTLPQQLGAPNVLKNALNSTARKVRRQIIKDSKGRYALKEKKALQSESKILSASASTLEAAVLAKGPMRDIMDFMTQPNTDTAAAAAKVLNSGAMKPLEAGGLKAFITTFRSGHTAIVQRRGAERLPVKKLLSPAVPHMMGNEEVRAEAEALAYETLQREIGKRIEQLTGAKGGKSGGHAATAVGYLLQQVLHGRKPWYSASATVVRREYRFRRPRQFGSEWYTRHPSAYHTTSERDA